MAKKTLPQFGLGSYNPMSGYTIQPRVVQNEDPMLSGGASTMTGSSMPDSMLNKIRQAAGLGRVGSNPVNVPVQESESGLVDKIRQSSVGQLFATDPVLKARMEAASAPVSPFQEQDDAFDLAPTEIDVFSIGGRGGLDAERMPLTGTSDQPGQETFGGAVPLELSSDPDEIFEDSSTVSKSQKRADESEAEFNARIEREERGIFDGDTSGAGSGTGSDDSKVETGSGSIDLMKSALDSYNDMVGLAPSGAKSMAEYKKEFSEATGIDISGDPDNKAALTAFGLALMQNKAGRGFNVGNMLSAVGAAGEKALPLMAEARKEAREGKIAAGRYALSEAKAADASRQKFLVDQSNYLQTRQDKILDYMQSRRDTLTDDASKRKHDFELEAVKHGFALRKQEIKDQMEAAKNDKYDKIETYQLLPNITALKIQRGFDGKKPVYADPSTTGMQVSETYKDVQLKLSMVDDLENILTGLANEGDQAFGGQVGKIIFDRVNKYSKLVGGPYAKIFNERGLTAESEAQVLVDAFVQANKRFISQETGNGVSDGDKKDIRTVTGDIVIGEDLDKNLARLDRVRDLFSKNKSLLEGEIIRLGDRTEFSSDDSYEKTQKIIADILDPVDILSSTSFDVRS